MFLRVSRRLLSTDAKLLKFTTSRGYMQCQPGPDDDIIVSMSSGVDSSVAALMYSQKYRNVRGIFMANWSSSADGNVGSGCNRDDGSKGKNSSCTIDKDWHEVQATCNQLGIPCERVSFEKEYWMDVFEPMLKMYERGLTPNPDVGCNKYVKFGAMIAHLEKYYKSKIKNDKKWWLVTGHYCRVLKHIETGENHMFRAAYRPKDQSYYLSQVPESVLDRILLPIGHYTKPEVRKIANDHGLVTSQKPDSQGLCFVSPQKKFSDFLDEYLEPNPGNIVDREGHIWGMHKGLWHATIGQRCGISLPQGDPKYKGIWLVCGKNISKNELIIAKKSDKHAFERTEVKVRDWNWINKGLNIEKVSRMPDLNCQTRSLQTDYKVAFLGLDGKDNNALLFKLDKPVFGVAPGQNMVLYQGNRVLGCGTIC